jgi:hypothetical protein
MSIHPGSLWLDQNWATLPRGRWVAANATGLLESSTDYVFLRNILQRMQVSLDDVTIAYVPAGIVQ